MKIIKLSPAERKIGLSIRALKSDEFRADWQEYQEGAGDGSGANEVGDAAGETTVDGVATPDAEGRALSFSGSEGPGCG